MESWIITWLLKKFRDKSFDMLWEKYLKKYHEKCLIKTIEEILTSIQNYVTKEIIVSFFNRYIKYVLFTFFGIIILVLLGGLYLLLTKEEFSIKENLMSINHDTYRGNWEAKARNNFHATSFVQNDRLYFTVHNESFEVKTFKLADSISLNELNEQDILISGKMGIVRSDYEKTFQGFFWNSDENVYDFHRLEFQDENFFVAKRSEENQDSLITNKTHSGFIDFSNYIKFKLAFRGDEIILYVSDLEIAKIQRFKISDDYFGIYCSGKTTIELVYLKIDILNTES